MAIQIDAPAAAPSSFEVRNPADGSVVETLRIDGPGDVAAKVDRVRAAQAEWEGLGNKGRYRWLGQLRDWILDHADEVTATMQAETGKVRADAAGEWAYLTDTINFYGRKANKFIGDEKIRPHNPLLRSKKLRVQFRPFPVVGFISPWNFPLILSLGDAIPALQAGCAVVIKPSEFTPLGLRDIVTAWKEEIGGPDVLDVALGLGDTGAALIDQVDFVHFTGSDRTGRKVMAQAAERLIPVSLELGGKDPLIVLRDADLDRAANAATWGSMANSGQICMSTERIYVEEPVYEEFVGKLQASVEQLRQGADGPDYEKDVGAMTSPISASGRSPPTPWSCLRPASLLRRASEA